MGGIVRYGEGIERMGVVSYFCQVGQIFEIAKQRGGYPFFIKEKAHFIFNFQILLFTTFK